MTVSDVLLGVGVGLVAIAVLFLLAVLMHRRQFSSIPGPPMSVRGAPGGDIHPWCARCHLGGVRPPSLCRTLFGDAAHMAEDSTSGPLRSVLNAILAYGRAEGICKLHVGPFTTLVFVTDPALVGDAPLPPPPLR